MREQLVTVFGGSGFIGRYVVEKLAAEGCRIRVAVRHPHEALFLKPLGAPGQIQLVQANIRSARSVQAAVQGADAVINLVGILFNSGAQTFSALQVEGAGHIAEAAARAGAARLVHVSAIGAAGDAVADYAKTKALGEEAVLAVFPSATIFRPSLVIGPEDGFFNRFAQLAKLLPVLPLPGTETLFQPVYVGDVAAAVAAAATGRLPAPKAGGKIYELGGPEVLSLRALLHRLMDYIDVQRSIVRLPWSVAMLQASFMGLLPNPPLTRDQVRLLRHDNIVSADRPGFAALGMKPQPIMAAMAKYCTQYRPKGQFERAR